MEWKQRKLNKASFSLREKAGMRENKTKQKPFIEHSPHPTLSAIAPALLYLPTSVSASLWRRLRAKELFFEKGLQESNFELFDEKTKNSKKSPFSPREKAGMRENKTKPNQCIKKCLNSLIIITFGTLLTTAQAAEIQWISATGGDWHNTANWSGNVMPTAIDDVIINIATENSIEYNADDTFINSLMLTGDINLIAGSITVTAPSQITGVLNVQQGATLAANGAEASLIVNGTANIDGGNIHALNGAQISLPGATRYQGAGKLLAQGIGSRLDLSALTDIGIGSPGTTDITEAFSRAISIYHKPYAVSEDGPTLGINEAFSRGVSIYHKPYAEPEDGPTLGINEAFSRGVSIYHKPYTPPEDGPTLGINEAFSRGVSIYHKPYSSPEDGPALGINEAFSRGVSIYHKPYSSPEDGPTLGINEAFSRQIMIENVVPPPPE